MYLPPINKYIVKKKKKDTTTAWKEESEVKSHAGEKNILRFISGWFSTILPSLLKV